MKGPVASYPADIRARPTPRKSCKADKEGPVIDARQNAWPPHRLGVEFRTLRLDEIVEPVFPQQPVQTSGEGMAREVGNSVTGTHIADCRSRVRFPVESTTCT